MHGLKPGHKVREVICLVGFEADFVMQVAAACSHCEDFQGDGVEAKGADYILAHSKRGRRRQTHDGHVRTFASEPVEFFIRGAEIVTPFRDAVGFVDGDAGEFALRVHRFDVPPEGFREAEFGRHVEEAGERVAAAEIVEDSVSFFGRGVAVYGSDGYVCGAEGGDLVVLVRCQLWGICRRRRRLCQTIKARSGLMTIVTAIPVSCKPFQGF